MDVYEQYPLYVLINSQHESTLPQDKEIITIGTRVINVSNSYVVLCMTYY